MFTNSMIEPRTTPESLFVIDNSKRQTFHMFGSNAAFAAISPRQYILTIIRKLPHSSCSWADRKYVTQFDLLL